MDRYTEIRSFSLVAEKGSFAAAALVEGVTPVVMGRRLDALERRGRLFGYLIAPPRQGTGWFRSTLPRIGLNKRGTRLREERAPLTDDDAGG